MRIAFLFLLASFSMTALFGQPLCSGDPRPKSACAGWEALQQIRSLIPDRIWEQDFAILIDREAFKKAIPDRISHEEQCGMHKCRSVLALSNSFYLRSILSGENVRIDDRYQEFQFSPFWKYPPRIRELRALEERIVKRGR